MGFGFIYILDIVQSLEAANNTICSNNVRYIESVRAKQNEYGATVSCIEVLNLLLGSCKMKILVRQTDFKLPLVIT